MSPYQACIADLDGTLYRAFPLKLAMMAELALFGLPALGTLSRFRAEHERVRELLELDAESPYTLQLKRAAKALGKPEREVARVVERWMFERPHKWIGVFARRSLLAELAQFRAEGGKLGVVSDYPAKYKLTALEKHLSFDVVVANGEAGGPRRLKPDPEGLLRAAEALEVEPEACLVIGDRADADGLAAERAGMAFHLVG